MHRRRAHGVPGLLSTALTASALHPKPAIGALAFHLGPDVQPESVKRGYNQRVEDELLATARWEEDGYRLFQIAVFAGSSRRGWFVTPVETNAVFLRSSHWGEIGGYDEAFVSPGGGLVNLDTWRRICEDKSCGLILLLGEATFHQVHGGIATNNPVSPWDAYHDEYVRIRGEPFMAPTRTPLLFGRFSPQTAASIAASTHALSEPAP